MPVKKTIKKTTDHTIKAVLAKESVGSKGLEPVKSTLVKSSKRDVIIPILTGAIVVAAFAVGYLYGKVSVYEKVSGNTNTQDKSAQPSPAQVAPVVDMKAIKGLLENKNNIVFGDANRKLIFVEFSDPSCPYCHIAAGKNPELNKEVDERFKLTSEGGKYLAPVPEMKKLLDQGVASYVWMYSPGHGNGMLATQALYCAKEQNKFWEVHDLMMTSKGYDLLNETVKNDVSKAAVMADFFKSVINTQALQSCLTSGKYAQRVESDEALSRQFGVRGTPSFFVNEKNFGGAYNFTDMKTAVEAALK